MHHMESSKRPTIMYNLLDIDDGWFEHTRSSSSEPPSIDKISAIEKNSGDQQGNHPEEVSLLDTPIEKRMKLPTRIMPTN